MECKRKSDAYETVPGDDAERKISSSSQALLSEGQYKDVRYSDLQSSEKETAQCSVEIDDSDSGGGQFCTWKVTAIVFIALTALLLATVLTAGGIWLRESDKLADSQKTSLEGAKHQQEEEEHRRVEREREIRAEEERKREEREQEIREEEGRKRIEREQEIMAEEEQKRVEREREIREEEKLKRIEMERKIRAEEDQKRLEREREIRAEEEKKREEREREIREEEERKRVDLEQEIRQEEDEKRRMLERLLEQRERRLEEMRAQCNSGQIISIGSTGLGVLLPLLPLLLLNCLMGY